jgi:hypothetical protein
MRHSLCAACTVAGLLLSTAAQAESVSKTAPLVSDQLPDFEPKGFDLGGFRLLPDFEYILYADDNVYAARDGKFLLPDGTLSNGTQADAAFIIVGGVEAKGRIGNIDLTANARTRIRRYDKLTTENSEGAEALVKLGWQPREGQKFGLEGGWRRVVEERGDPEALQLTSTGPRLANIFESEAKFSQEGGKMLVATDVVVRKFDFLGTANARRDFSSQFVSLTLGRSIGSRLYGTATAFVTNRDFRLPLTTGAIQDETTIGGRIGVATKDRGLIEGRASIGVFRLNPAEPTQKGRSGISADVALTFRPQQRTAISLNVFSGDVATFRLGAVARSDTTASINVQQEIRHNLYATAGLSYLRAEFFGSGDLEKAISPRVEVEWLATKRLSIAGYVSYTDRTSNIAEEVFDRTRGGFSLRLRF